MCKLYDKSIYTPLPSLIQNKMETKKCQFCDKELEAYSESQLEYMYTQHLLAKHRDKIKVYNSISGKFELLKSLKKMEDKKRADKKTS